MKWRKALLSATVIIVLAAAALVGSDAWVNRSTKNQLFTDVSTVPAKKVGLLLGTSKYLKGGRINLYYQYRIDAAVKLFKAGKIKFVLISGDNSEEHYNEPESMKNDLLAAGIPAANIVLDYAGFRTLDSLLRCKIVFGTTDITIISQEFHNQRALFIANHKDINAVAYNAGAVSVAAGGLRTNIREKFARVKMMLDLLFGKDAKFYGDKIEIK